MFYLKNFLFQIFWKHKILGPFFLSISLVLILLCAFPSKLEKFLWQKEQGMMPQDHFHAIVNNRINISKIIRKMKGLPGVARIQKVSTRELRSSTEKILKESLPELPIESLDFDYTGVRVFYDKGMRENSKVLIRDYFKRLAGDNNSILGPIVRGEKEGLKLFQWLLEKKKLVLSIIFNLVLIVWILIAALFIRSLRKSSFLIENYQRRKFVYLKTALFLPALIVFFWLIWRENTEALKINDFLIVIVPFAVFITPSAFKQSWQD